MKKMLALVLSLVMVFGLVGCGKNAGGSDNDGSTKLTVWYWGEQEIPGYKQYMEEMAQKYSSETDGISVEVVLQESDTLYSALRTAEQAGEGPDLAFLWGGTQALDDVWLGNLAPISDYMTEEELSCMTASALSETNWDGKQWGFPAYSVCFGIAYNKQMFAAAGLDPENPPTTWQDFIAACDALKAAGYTPITTDDLYAVNVYGYYLAKLKGDDWVFELVNDATKAMWDDPACLEAAKAIQELADKGYYAANVASNKFPSAQQEMVIEEKTAMYLNGTWLPNEVKDTAREDFPWGQFAFPTVPGGVDGPEAGAYGCTGLAINKNADPKVAEAAFSFFVFLTSGEWDKTYAEETRSIPMDQANAWPAALADAEKIIPAYTTRYYSQTAIRMNNDVLPVIQSGVINLISGNMTAEQFIAEMKK